MKCKNCGAELAEDVKFCRECGAEVDLGDHNKLYCRECGSKIRQGEKFCSNCGSPIIDVKTVNLEQMAENNEVNTDQQIDEKTVFNNIHEDENESEEKPFDFSQFHKPKSSASTVTTSERIKNKGKEIWNKLELLEKVMTVFLIFGVIFLMIGVGIQNYIAVGIAVLQIIVLIISFLFHKGIIKSQNKRLS